MISPSCHKITVLGGTVDQILVMTMKDKGNFSQMETKQIWRGVKPGGRPGEGEGRGGYSRAHV